MANPGFGREPVNVVKSVSTGGGGGGASTIADGANVVEGSLADAAVTTNIAGTISGKLRGVVALLGTISTALSTIASDITGKLTVQGTIAHDSAAADNPVQIGARAATTQPSAVADGDVVRLMSTILGKQVIMPYSPPNLVVSGNSGAIVNDTATNVIAADSGASVKYYVTDVIVTNSHATVGTLVTIQDDEGSPTVICQGYAAPAGGGFTHHFACPVPTAADAHIHALCGTTGSNVYVTVVAYKAP